MLKSRDRNISAFLLVDLRYFLFYCGELVSQKKYFSIDLHPCLKSFQNLVCKGKFFAYNDHVLTGSRLFFGVLAQLVERLVCTEEARSSNLLDSTKNKHSKNDIRACSSVG